MLRTRGDVIPVRGSDRRIPLDGRSELPRSVAFLSRRQPQSFTTVVPRNTVLDGGQWERLGVGRDPDGAHGGAHNASPSAPEMGVLHVLSRPFVAAPRNSIGVVLIHLPIADAALVNVCDRAPAKSAPSMTQTLDVSEG